MSTINLKINNRAGDFPEQRIPNSQRIILGVLVVLIML